MRFKPTREDYIGASDVEILRDDALGVLVVCSPDGSHFKAFGGRRQRPDMNFYVRSIEARDAAITKWYEGLKARAEAKAAQRMEIQRGGHGLVIGDVLRCAWGYEQTNQDYYQVVGLAGKMTVEIRRIESLREHTGDMVGIAVPRLGAFIGDVLRRRSDASGLVRIEDRLYARREPYEVVGGVRVFTPARWSSYA